MTRSFDRRSILLSILLGSCASLAPVSRLWAAGGDLSTREAFDENTPVELARDLSLRPYEDEARVLPDPLRDMSYDDYQAIRPVQKGLLWSKSNSRFRVDMFHLGRGFQKPVILNVVEDGMASQMPFSPGGFHYGSDEIKDAAGELKQGFAGFRAFYSADWERDFIAFLGASYFRAVGGEKQYGLSARGLALNTTSFGQEEFPRFTTFWLEKPEEHSHMLRIHALMDSPSLTGAYRFTIRPGRVTTIDVDATIFSREQIDELGVAPITSMYFYGENDFSARNDFRPEIHDSDGLYVVTGDGERIWRPVSNTKAPRASFFRGDHPSGFGLFQRDRSFENYQDDGVYYNRRPSLWVTPKGDWGPGEVVLVELPAADETQDNLVAFWRPKEGPQPGEERTYSYRLSFGDIRPERLDSLAAVVATRIGVGGIPGQENNNPASRKFVIDFEGGPLSMLTKETEVTPEIQVSSGEISAQAARLNLDTGGWRMNFDFLPENEEDVEMRAFLSFEGRRLTETWLYRWNPVG